VGWWATASTSGPQQRNIDRTISVLRPSSSASPCLITETGDQPGFDQADWTRRSSPGCGQLLMDRLKPVRAVPDAGLRTRNWRSPPNPRTEKAFHDGASSRPGGPWTMPGPGWDRGRGFGLGLGGTARGSRPVGRCSPGRPPGAVVGAAACWWRAQDVRLAPRPLSPVDRRAHRDDRAGVRRTRLRGESTTRLVSNQSGPTSPLGPPRLDLVDALDVKVPVSG